MNNLKHTPGPWGYNRTHERSLNYWYVITHHGGYGPVVDVGGTDLNGQIAEAKHLITDPKEIEANARLIAAAPEMLEALINCMQDMIDRYGFNFITRADLNPGIISWMNRNIICIEKATGLKIEEVIK